MVSTVSETPWLEFIARIMGEVPSVAPPTFDPDLFYCDPDDPPSHLVPRHSIRIESSSPLIWNPSTCLCSDGELPPPFEGREVLVSGFDLRGPVVWTQDPVVDFWQPFWFGSALRHLLSEVRPGQPAPANLPSGVSNVLANTGVLVSPDFISQRRKGWAAKVQSARTAFSRGFAPVADLIHPFHIAALRRYVRRLVRRGRVHLGDGQSPLRYVQYNDLVLKFFHDQLTSALSDIAGEILKPSYCYMGSYLKGAELPIHTDRLQCEFTLSLCLDFAPEPASETPWPIHLETPEGTVTVYLAIGDALFFRGRQIPHYRKPLEHGVASTSIFFHYVKKDFVGTLG
jgi:hypothetical protein